MIRKIASISRKSLLIVLVVIVAVGAGFYGYKHRTKPVATKGLPEYLNFGNNYVFSIPKSYTVDSQSVLGAELIYSTPLTAKTLEDVYSQNGMATQAVNLTDHSGKAFKDYINGNYLSDLKKNLSTSDIKIKFGKTNGSDDARVTVKKDGQQIRFIYLKAGQHPASAIGKTESDAFKVIEQTLTDVENSDLKNEVNGIKLSTQSSLQLAKNQKAQDLYSSATPELRSQSTQAQLTAALSAATPYLDQNITISGGSYAQGNFSAALRFTPLNQNDSQPTFGAITLKKSDNQWKLQSLSLPTPKQ